VGTSALARLCGLPLVSMVKTVLDLTRKFSYVSASCKAHRGKSTL
jgi:hypothetical protein